MKYKDFVSALRRNGLEGDHAEGAAATVLGELAGGLTWLAAHLLVSGLPSRMKSEILERSFGSSMTRFSLDVLTRRVAEQDEIGMEDAGMRVAAVLRALNSTLPEHSRERVWSELALVWRELEATTSAA